MSHAMAEVLMTMPWWALAALVFLSRGPTRLRDWAGALGALRASAAGGATSAVAAAAAPWGRLGGG